MINISQNEKEKYLGDLNEDDFREQVVRRLFKRLGFSDGRDLCGPEEQGKDAVFIELDKFGHREVVCVQTKVGNINLASDAQKNLLNVTAQLRTALEAPFHNVLTKVKEYPAKVYLVASGKINLPARQHITSELKGESRIFYLDRDDLIKLIDEKCMEIWQQIRADVYPYLNALAKLVEDQSLLGPNAASIAGIKSYYAASDRAFVDLKLVKSVAKPRQQSGRLIEDFEFSETNITDLLGLKGERLLMLGDAGSGKSTILIRAAYLMAKAAAAGGTNYRVPVIVRTNEFSIEKSLEEVMESSVGELISDGVMPYTLEDFEAGKVILLIDGLDEVADIVKRSHVVNQLNEFYAMYPRCSVIITARPYSSIEQIAGLKAFVRCRISSMSLATAEKMLTNYQRKNLDQRHAKEIMRRIDGIHGIELNPLLVTVFALTTEADRKDIPANITELFSKFTELMLGRWDESKGVSQQFQAKVKEHLVSSFAFEIHKLRRTQFTRVEFELHANTMLLAMNHQANAVQMIEEILVRSGLFREIGESFEFRHQLMQEYFAGKGVSSIDQIKELVSDEWWRNPIVFYFGTKPSDVHSLLDVATSQTTQASDACITIGLALQTCYLSRIEDKVDVWKWVVDALSGITERIDQEKSDNPYPVLHFLTHYILSRDAVALSGIERSDVDALNWAIHGNHFSSNPEYRKFWAYTALCENGNLELLKDMLDKHPLSNEYLSFSLFLGCSLVEKVRSVNELQKEAAKQIKKKMSGKVSVIQYQFAKEYRGQLLEYRRGKIVALDEDESYQLSDDKNGRIIDI